MLKRFCIATMVLMVTVMVTTSGFSTIIVGAKGGYFVWNPFLKDLLSEMSAMAGRDMGDVKKGTGVLAGPVFSVSLTDDLSLSVSGLFGIQDSQWKDDVVSGSNFEHSTNSFHEKRYDIDSAINYILTSNIKLFAGYKYQYVDVDTFDHFTVEYDTSSISSFQISSTRWKSRSHGPALGIGLSYPIDETYFITSNVSVIYFFPTTLDSKTKSKLNFTGTLEYDEYSSDIDISQWGINVEPAIGAKISESIIGTVGVRFQWLSMKLENSTFQSDRLNDYLYGIFVSVMYVY